MSVNHIVLIGRMGRDAELRSTSTGKEVANFTMAVQRKFKGADGVDCDWFSVSCWGQTAGFVANYLGKGRLVAVEGRLQSRKYTAQDGSQREVVEVVADSVQGLDRPRNDAPQTTQSTTQTAQEDEYDPFAD